MFKQNGFKMFVVVSELQPNLGYVVLDIVVDDFLEYLFLIAKRQIRIVYEFGEHKDINTVLDCTRINTSANIINKYQSLVESIFQYDLSTVVLNMTALIDLNLI